MWRKTGTLLPYHHGILKVGSLDFIMNGKLVGARAVATHFHTEYDMILCQNYTGFLVSSMRLVVKRFWMQQLVERDYALCDLPRGSRCLCQFYRAFLSVCVVHSAIHQRELGCNPTPGNTGTPASCPRIIWRSVNCEVLPRCCSTGSRQPIQLSDHTLGIMYLGKFHIDIMLPNFFGGA